MSNKNMDWNQFLAEFVLRAMVKNINEQYFSPDAAARLARLAWDAIQAAELPESEKAKQAPAPSFVLTAAPALIPSNSMELKQLAELAAAKGFSWIAQDGRNGVWYGYKIRPEYKEHIEEWVTGSSIECEPIQLPDTTDYSKQLFNVNELLTNEQ